MRVRVFFTPAPDSGCPFLGPYLEVPNDATVADIYQAAFDWFSAETSKEDFHQSINPKFGGVSCEIDQYDVEIAENL